MVGGGNRGVHAESGRIQGFIVNNGGFRGVQVGKGMQGCGYRGVQVGRGDAGVCLQGCASG